MGSGWGTYVYLWRIHFDVWQNQYNIVKLKNKIKRKKIMNKNTSRGSYKANYRNKVSHRTLVTILWSPVI